MKQTGITVKYDSEKLLALMKYMSAKGVSPEKELQENLERMYTRYVPISVREFINYRSGAEGTMKTAGDE